jgi:hypothetical protein
MQLQVYASGTGNQRTPLFFLDWFRRRKQQQQQGMAVQHAHKDHIHIVASSTESSLPVSYALSPIKSSGFKAVFSRSSPVRVMPIHTHVLHTLGVAQTQQLQPSAASFDPSPSPSTASAAAAAADAACVLEPADVAAERLRTAAVDDYEEHPLVIRALHKVYPGQDGQPPKVWMWAGPVCVCVQQLQQPRSMSVRQCVSGKTQSGVLHEAGPAACFQLLDHVGGCVAPTAAVRAVLCLLDPACCAPAGPGCGQGRVLWLAGA